MEQASTVTEPPSILPIQELPPFRFDSGPTARPTQPWADRPRCWEPDYDGDRSPVEPTRFPWPAPPLWWSQAAIWFAAATVASSVVAYLRLQGGQSSTLLVLAMIAVSMVYHFTTKLDSLFWLNARGVLLIDDHSITIKNGRLWDNTTRVNLDSILAINVFEHIDRRSSSNAQLRSYLLAARGDGMGRGLAKTVLHRQSVADHLVDNPSEIGVFVIPISDFDDDAIVTINRGLGPAARKVEVSYESSSDS